MNRKQRRAAPVAASAGAAFARALHLHRAGRIEDAERGYREILAEEPNHAESLHFLGLAAHQSGRHDAAAGLMTRALAAGGENPSVLYNLAGVLRALGRAEEAAAQYRRVLQLQPGNAAALNNLGRALQESDQPEAAEACYRQALAIMPGDVRVLGNLGDALREQGRAAEAIAYLRRAVAAAPAMAEAHGNLGTALQQTGRLDEACACYARAAALRPDLAIAHANLGRVRLALGDPEAALAHAQRAQAIADGAEHRRLLAECLRPLRPAAEAAATAVEPLLLRAFAERWDRPEKLAHTAAQVLRTTPPLGPHLADGAAGAGEAALDAAASSPLLLALLAATPVCDLDLERLLTACRQALLCGLAETESRIALAASLARQCFINEYVFAETAAERDAVATEAVWHQAALAAGTPLPSLRLATLACYRPLHTIPGAERLTDAGLPAPLAALVEQQVRRPLAERGHRETIPRLTPIGDATSQAVQRQYEENPYPRWVDAPSLERPRSLASLVRRVAPGAALRAPPGGGAPEILVAGCGTGQQSVELARQVQGARVLAIDLSLASLAYARRQTEALGIGTIEYAQADILELGALDRRFDLIAATGVLHHMADPLAGWRALLRLLRPAGVMQIGLYSTRARADVVAAQRAIGDRDAAPDAIRRARALISTSADAAARRIAMSADFYSLSACRDLLFHVRETTFGLPEIGAFLREERLALLGLDLDPAIIAAHQARFPAAPINDLGRWDAFEAEHPHTFAGMFRFWVQGPA